MGDTIEALKDEFGLSLRDDYIDFLRFAGAGLEYNALRPWPGVSEASAGVDQDDVEEESDEYWVLDIASLWSADHLYGALEEARQGNGHLDAWHLQLLPRAYPIGVGFGGDFFVQAVDGKWAGNVFHLPHDEWPYDDVEDLFGLKTERLLDDLCCHYAAEDMRDFYATLCRLRGAA